MAPGRAADGGAHRSVPTPLRRGTAAVAVGGGLSLLAGATPAHAAEPVPVVLMTPSVVPVVPEPDLVDATRLVATVALTEKQAVERVAAAKAAAGREAARVRAAAAEKTEKAAAAPAGGSSDCGLDTSGLGAVKSHVRAAAEFLGCRFGEPSMHGVAGRAGSSDHPSGKALDLMTDGATGDAIAACALKNMDALGISYVIWEQRINMGDGWESMEDRGGDTANHRDHVHLSFGSGAGSGRPVAC